MGLHEKCCTILHNFVVILQIFAIFCAFFVLIFQTPSCVSDTFQSFYNSVVSILYERGITADPSIPCVANITEPWNNLFLPKMSYFHAFEFHSGTLSGTVVHNYSLHGSVQGLLRVSNAITATHSIHCRGYTGLGILISYNSCIKGVSCPTVGCWSSCFYSDSTGKS